jgi:hypothetical protein
VIVVPAGLVVQSKLYNVPTGKPVVAEVTVISPSNSLLHAVLPKLAKLIVGNLRSSRTVTLNGELAQPEAGEVIAVLVAVTK